MVREVQLQGRDRDIPIIDGFQIGPVIQRMLDCLQAEPIIGMPRGS